MSEDQSSSGSGRKSFLGRLSRVFTSEPRDRVELKELINDSQQRGVLDSDAQAMMEGALSVADLEVGDIMVPRSQMVVVRRNEQLEDFLPTILESGHSRFPVIGEDRDEVQGILLAKDLLKHLVEGKEEIRLVDALRPALVVREDMRLNVLLRQFRTSRSHLAIVVDEYGGVSGLITLEDVLEEIVGEIDDEHDEAEESAVQLIADNRYRVNALTPIDEFNDRFDCELSDEEFDTIGGLVLDEFGRVPEDGESKVINERFKFRVADSDSRRIITLEMNDLDGQ